MSKKTVFVLAAVVFALGLGVGFVIGNRPSAPTPTAPVAPSTTQTPVTPAPTPPAPKPVPSATAPAAVSLHEVLSLAPDSAAFAIAFPNPARFEEKVAALAGRLVPGANDSTKTAVNEFLTDVFEMPAGASESPEAFLRAKGLNVSAPLAVFVDISPCVASATATMEAVRAEEAQKQKEAKAPAKKKEAPNKAAGKKTDAKAAKKVAKDAAEGNGPGKGVVVAKKATDASKAENTKKAKAPGKKAAKQPNKEAAAAAEARPAESQAQEGSQENAAAVPVERIREQMAPPRGVAVLSCSDPMLAETSLKQSLEGPNGPFPGSKPEEVMEAEVTLHCYAPDKFAYFLAGNRLVIGSSLELLKEAARRVASPWPVRYGTPECPATGADEVVALARLDRLAAARKELLPALLAAQHQAAPGAMDAVLESTQKWIDEGPDPLVGVLTWPESRLEFNVRADLAQHPALAAIASEAKPLHLAPILPDTAQFLLALSLTPTVKGLLGQNPWLNSFVPHENTAGAPPVPTPAQIAQILGNELAAAVTFNLGFRICVAAEIADQDGFKKAVPFLALPGLPVEDTEGVPVTVFGGGILPMEIRMAFLDSTFLLATSREDMLALIQRGKAKTIGARFQGVDALVDSATPCLGAFLLDTALLNDALMPLAQVSGGMPVESHATMQAFTSVVSQVRGTKQVRGDWFQGQLRMDLKPEEQQAAAGTPGSAAPTPVPEPSPEPKVEESAQAPAAK